MATTQADIDALAAKLEADNTALAAGVASLVALAESQKAQIADLQAKIDAGQPLDLTQLQSDVEAIGTIASQFMQATATTTDTSTTDAPAVNS